MVLLTRGLRLRQLTNEFWARAIALRGCRRERLWLEERMGLRKSALNAATVASVQGQAPASPRVAPASAFSSLGLLVSLVDRS